VVDRTRHGHQRQAEPVGLQPHGAPHDQRKRAFDIDRMLLDAGADPNIRDDKYDATVLAWAEFCERPQLAERERDGNARAVSRYLDPRLPPFSAAIMQERVRLNAKAKASSGRQ
jgi:hypothetical protein